MTQVIHIFTTLTEMLKRVIQSPIHLAEIASKQCDVPRKSQRMSGVGVAKVRGVSQLHARVTTEQAKEEQRAHTNRVSSREANLRLAKRRYGDRIP